MEFTNQCVLCEFSQNNQKRVFSIKTTNFSHIKPSAFLAVSSQKLKSFGIYCDLLKPQQPLIFSGSNKPYEVFSVRKISVFLKTTCGAQKTSAGHFFALKAAKDCFLVLKPAFLGAFYDFFAKTAVFPFIATTIVLGGTIRYVFQKISLSDLVCAVVYEGPHRTRFLTAFFRFLKEKSRNLTEFVQKTDFSHKLALSLEKEDDLSSDMRFFKDLPAVKRFYSLKDDSLCVNERGTNEFVLFCKSLLLNSRSGDAESEYSELKRIRDFVDTEAPRLIPLVFG